MKNIRRMFSVLAAVLVALSVVGPVSADGPTPTAAICPATPSPTSPFPTYQFPTFQGFPTSGIPTLTRTPCPPGASCPTVTVVPTNTLTATVTPSPAPTVTPTVTSAGRLQVISYYGSDVVSPESLHNQVFVSPGVGGISDLVYWSLSDTGTGHPNYSDSLWSSVTVKNISGSSLLVYFAGYVSFNQSYYFSYDEATLVSPAGNFSMGAVHPVRDIPSQPVYTMSPNETKTFGLSHGGAALGTHYSAFSYLHKGVISAVPNSSYNTPTAVPTSTAVPVVPCVSGNGYENINSEIIGFTAPQSVAGGCYTIIPQMTIDIPDLVIESAPYPITDLGIEGVELCVNYWSMSLRFFDFDAFTVLTLLLNLACVVLLYREFRS